jgi:hypothetical protein
MPHLSNHALHGVRVLTVVEVLIADEKAGDDAYCNEQPFHEWAILKLIQPMLRIVAGPL